MSGLRIVCLMASLFTVCRATISSLRYSAKLELDNKMSNDELVGQHEAQSLTECAATCQKDCGFFGYNPTLKKCRTHKKAFTSGMSDENGWRYYFPEFTTAPQDKPILSKIEELFGENNIDFSCTGRPGYPDGNLKFEIKLSNEMEFRPYQFYSAKITNEDKNCYRTQTVNATHLFTMEWNQAKIRCLSGDKYDETNVYLIPPTICEKVPVNRSVRHPYDKHKYITCKREAPQARSCPRDVFSFIFSLYIIFVYHDDAMLDTERSDHNLSGMSFSTPDRDNNRSSIGNCAAFYNIRGGWWFNRCHFAFLNGQWSPGSWEDPWWPRVKWGTSVKETNMMISRH